MLRVKEHILSAFLSSAFAAHALDVAGTVFDKLSHPLPGAKVCIQGTAACVVTAADGSFHVTGASSSIRSDAGSGGFALEFRGGRFFLAAASAGRAGLEWFDARGARLAPAREVDLSRGSNDLGSPASLGLASAAGGGLLFARLSLGNTEVTWKAVLGDAYGAVTAERRAGAPSAKTAAAAGAIEASKDGFRPSVYYAADKETGALVVLNGLADSVLFDGKTLNGWDEMPGIWTVKDGSIDGYSNTAGKFPGTFIASVGDFDTFRLTLTERIALANDHLGICIWGTHLGAGNGGAGKCLVVIPPDGSMWDYGSGAIHGAKSGNAGVDSHVWHQVEMLAVKSTGQILVAVNGIQITTYKDGNPARLPKGPVRLQLHAWTGPQESQYRDVAIEVNPADQRLLSLKH